MSLYEGFITGGCKECVDLPGKSVFRLVIKGILGGHREECL